MRFTKYYTNGHQAEVEIELLKDYGKYGLYQVYKIDGNKRTPIYKECFSPHDIRRIERRGVFVERLGIRIGRIELLNREGLVEDETI